MSAQTLFFFFNIISHCRSLAFSYEFLDQLVSSTKWPDGFYLFVFIFGGTGV
jgi:hypothetical protein